MENNEISKARFAEIKAAVGNPFEVSPTVYMQRLEEETARDNSLIPFLNMASSDFTPRQSPLQWLQKLTTTDFANVEEICHVRFQLVSDFMDKFDLVANDEGTFAVSPWPGSLSYEEIDGDVHPGLLRLETSALHGAGDSLPALILPVGQLLKRVNCDSVTSYWPETDYVLVIDAVAPGHPVWLIYDRNPLDDLGDRHIVDPTYQPLIFKGIGHNFDAAQIFPSVHDWIQSYGNVDFTQFEESIKATCITGAVKVKESPEAEAAELLRH
ncbi:uncharacterized protein BKA55DRAFT_535779 [Fusarium redolens]|uniref:Uncharacterized protein n=1 Tax=Fusarium redolens TaxID=48865 RepID=A0A9P9KKT5_FUSRE|nr:uncharacterized protein BKA55DRAFT_535779 [Fusarium redolens]KAH7260756.1 hypothetical protein BKA55DRAFT_535779 [Fusarium redolens]